MGQVGDRLKRAPQAARWSSLQERADDCVEAVAITVDRMPQRHEPSRFGEEQKKNAIEHRQRMLEEHTGWKRQARTRDQGRHDSCLLYTSDAADERSSVDLGGRR